MDVLVRTPFPPAIQEASWRDAIALMLDLLRAVYQDIDVFAIHLDPAARVAALRDVTQQISELEAAYQEAEG